MIQEINATTTFLQEKTNFTPQVGIILGSGLGGLVKAIDIKHSFGYEQIPGFPVSTVEGHSGKLIFGILGGKNVVAMQGRFHYYEGYSLQQVTFPVRVMKAMGVQTLLLSNAAGGLNTSFEVGDLMIITDHINFFPDNPLRGKNHEQLGTRFPEMSQAWSPMLISMARQIARNNNIRYQTGVYIGSPGPTLETPAEYNMFRLLGADATGMSTVPEVIVARHAQMDCFGISIITNMAKPADTDKPTTHDEVQQVAQVAERNMTLIFSQLIEGL